MTVHLVKLCVGVDGVAELQAWQTERLKMLRKARQRPQLCHRTLQKPRRADEILDGGSLYWVIKGSILARQRVIALTETAKDDGTPCCGIVLDSALVLTRPRARRAFQGWRYLDAADAPADLRAISAADAEMPEAMRAALRELRLIDF